MGNVGERVSRALRQEFPDGPVVITFTAQDLSLIPGQGTNIGEENTPNTSPESSDSLPKILS